MGGDEPLDFRLVVRKLRQLIEGALAEGLAVRIRQFLETYAARQLKFIPLDMGGRKLTEDISSPTGKRAGLPLNELLRSLVEELLVALQGSIAFDFHFVLELKGAVILHSQ